MKKKTLIVNCPTCGEKVEWEETSRWKPFCSERCKLIDLGDWAEGNNRIPEDPEIGTPNELPQVIDDIDNHH
ncbi:MAG: DNA gyrase inhibitor YacG [Gammaproteobacteria bacterium]|nr:DNA gyrase inhibitor YacG [Gammaproteobacteria bacterium]